MSEESLPVLTSGSLRLRPASAGDAEALLAMLTEPEVAMWWGR